MKLFKQVLVLLFLVMFSVINVNATTYDFNSTALQDYNNAKLNTYTYGRFTPANFQADVKLENLNTPVYILVKSYTALSTDINVTYETPNGNLTRALHVIKTLNNIFEIKPQNLKDTTSFRINTGNDSISYTMVISNDYIVKEDSTSTTILKAISDVIDINIGFWMILFYMMMFIIVIGSIGILISFSFKIYAWASHFSDKKKTIICGGASHSKKNKEN